MKTPLQLNLCDNSIRCPIQEFLGPGWIGAGGHDYCTTLNFGILTTTG